MRSNAKSDNKPDSKPNSTGSGWQAQTSDRAMLISGNDDYQQIIAETAFFQAQQRAKELGWGGSDQHQS